MIVVRILAGEAGECFSSFPTRIRDAELGVLARGWPLLADVMSVSYRRMVRLIYAGWLPQGEVLRRSLETAWQKWPHFQSALTCSAGEVPQV